MSAGQHDQQSRGPDNNLPCPWCGGKQDLSSLDIAEDMHITCDECEQIYTLTSLSHEATCPNPKCLQPRLITSMEVAENAFTTCEACTHVFCVGDAKLATFLQAERA